MRGVKMPSYQQNSRYSNYLCHNQNSKCLFSQSQTHVRVWSELTDDSESGDGWCLHGLSVEKQLSERVVVAQRAASVRSRAMAHRYTDTKTRTLLYSLSVTVSAAAATIFDRNQGEIVCSFNKDQTEKDRGNNNWTTTQVLIYGT